MMNCTCNAYLFSHQPGFGHCQFDDAAALMWEMYRYELTPMEYARHDQGEAGETVHNIATAFGLNLTEKKCTGEYCGGEMFIPEEFSPGEFTTCCPECAEMYRGIDQMIAALSEQYEREVTAWMYGLEMPTRAVTS